MKSRLSGKAIELRKQGLSYSEILKQVPVAKSTLSLWLRSVGLSKRQKQRLTAKKLTSARRGAEAKRRIRIQETERIQREAKAQIGQLSRRELLLIGAMLYWAEGSKEKEWKPGSGVEFMNSDAKMIRLYLKWLEDICGVSKERIKFSLHIHENHKYRLDEVISHWSKATGFPIKSFSTVYFKRHNPKTRRRNIDEAYFGTLSVRVSASSSLNRKIAGWVKGVVESSESD